MLALALAWAAPARAETATWYGDESGRYTASGEVYDASDLTCAHRSYPFDTILRVWWRGRYVICRVNDRGPARSTGADIDLSYGAARALGVLDIGRAHVGIEHLGRMLE